MSCWGVRAGGAALNPNPICTYGVSHLCPIHPNSPFSQPSHRTSPTAISTALIRISHACRLQFFPRMRDESLPSLPTLSSQPTSHPHSCLALSSTVASYLTGIVRGCVPLARSDALPQLGGSGDGERAARKGKVILLSIGSGAGLLEGLLADMFVKEREDDDGGVDMGATETVAVTLEPNLDVDVDVQVYGIEVPSPGGDLNRYIPPSRRVVVRGVWDVLTPENVQCWLGRGVVRDEGGRLAVVEGDRAVGATSGRGASAENVREEPSPAWNAPAHDSTAATSAEAAAVLMFVYPRQPSLVSRYLDAWLANDDAAGADRAALSGTQEEPSAPQYDPLAALIWAGPRADWSDYEAIFDSRGKNVWDVSQAWGADAGVGEGEGVVVARRRRG